MALTQHLCEAESYDFFQPLQLTARIERSVQPGTAAKTG